MVKIVKLSLYINTETIFACDFYRVVASVIESEYLCCQEN